jgi:rhodanese-related sulfurtransferase
MFRRSRFGSLVSPITKVMCCGRRLSVHAVIHSLLFLFLFSSFELWIGATAAPVLAGHGAGAVLILPIEYVKLQFDNGRKVTAVDLRPVEDYQRGHVPGARSLPLNELVARFEEVPKFGLVVLYCECPLGDAEDAYRFLREHGYRNLSVMSEGFDAWVKRGYPIDR